MDLQAVLNEVESWPVEERIQLVQAVWERLADQGNEPGLTEEEKAELERRLAEDNAAPDDVVPWEEVKAQALARIRR
jgi:putative addiction module component (TIGR02574 family)